jgi:hypothetical protein
MGVRGVRGVLRDHGPGQLDQRIMPTLAAFMLIFAVSTALNFLL